MKVTQTAIKFEKNNNLVGHIKRRLESSQQKSLWILDLQNLTLSFNIWTGILTALEENDHVIQLSLKIQNKDGKFWRKLFGKLKKELHYICLETE